MDEAVVMAATAMVMEQEVEAMETIGGIIRIRLIKELIHGIVREGMIEIVGIRRGIAGTVEITVETVATIETLEITMNNTVRAKAREFSPDSVYRPAYLMMTLEDHR